MIVVDCAQRTPEWFAARVGLLTASEAATMLSRPTKKGVTETLGRAELRRRLATESMTGESIEEEGFGFVSDWMRRGTALEDEAKGVYEALTGELVQRIGFLKHDTLPIGCSPDGILGDFEGGLELKCPKFNTHWEYLLLKDQVPSEYLAQITHSLFVTGLPFWDFVSYHPKFIGATRIYRVRVPRDAVDLAAYALAVQLFWDEVEKTAEELRALCAA